MWDKFWLPVSLYVPSSVSTRTRTSNSANPRSPLVYSRTTTPGESLSVYNVYREEPMRSSSCSAGNHRDGYMPEAARMKLDGFSPSFIPATETYDPHLSRSRLRNSKRISRWKVVISDFGTSNAYSRISEVDIGSDYAPWSRSGVNYLGMVSLLVCPSSFLPLPDYADVRLLAGPTWSSWNYRYQSTTRTQFGQLSDIHDWCIDWISHHRSRRASKVDVIRVLFRHDWNVDRWWIAESSWRR